MMIAISSGEICISFDFREDAAVAVSAAQVERFIARARDVGPDDFPLRRQAETQECLLRNARREIDFGRHLAALQMRFEREGYIAEPRQRALDDNSLPVIQPSARRREGQPQRIGAAVVVHVPILHEQIAKLNQKTRIGSAVRWKSDLATVAIEWLNAGDFA